MPGFFICLLFIGGVTAASALIGGVGFVALLVIAVVMSIALALAIRDSPALPAVVLAAWFFGPLIRRLVDWQGGAFTPVTVLSLLPLMSTSALIIPLWPRLKLISGRLAQALALICLPVVVASCTGYMQYGPSAVLEACDWLMPVLFVPYLATSPWLHRHLNDVVRMVVMLACCTALYAVVQFQLLPAWDKLWLTQCGMVSVGRPIAGQFRAWGTLNAPEPAALMWVSALLVTLGCPSMVLPRRIAALVLLAVAVGISLVRIAWVTGFVGVFSLVLIRRRKKGQQLLVGMMLCCVIGLTALPFIPGGDRISDRIQTFSDLSNDRSLQARNDIYQSMLLSILSNPLGRGMGFKTAGRVSDGEALYVIDNGFGELGVTLGIPGMIVWSAGVLQLMIIVSNRLAHRKGNARYFPEAGIAVLCASWFAMPAVFSFSGLGGVLTWFYAGISLVKNQEMRQEIQHPLLRP